MMSSKRTKNTKILIADDHPIFRHGLVQVITKRTDMTVVGEAETGLEVLEAVQIEHPDIIILDIDMPGMDGIETTKNLRQKTIKSKIIFLTMHKNRAILRSMAPLKVKGYVLKDSAMQEIVECIEIVRRGGFYLSHSLNDMIVAEVAPPSATSLTSLESLTPTEKKVLALIAGSKTNIEIAEELFVSVRTVETHRYNICTKLELKGTHALFKFAVRNRATILSNLDN